MSCHIFDFPDHVPCILGSCEFLLKFPFLSLLLVVDSELAIVLTSCFVSFFQILCPGMIVCLELLLVSPVCSFLLV